MKNKIDDVLEIEVDSALEDDVVTIVAEPTDIEDDILKTDMSALDSFEPKEKELPSRNNGVFDAPAVALMSKWLTGADDFKISGQVKSMLKFMPTVIAVEWGLGGCPLIEALQGRVGARATGYIDLETVKALQKFLIKEGFVLEETGVWDEETTNTFIQFLLSDK